MKCKACAYENGRVLYEPVYSPCIMEAFSLTSAKAPSQPALVYKRWACGTCGKYHFEDGSLYVNPFKE